jgi:hypothetical protein
VLAKMPRARNPTIPASVDDIEKTRLNEIKSINSQRTDSTPLSQYYEIWVDDTDKEVVAIGEGKEVATSEGLHTINFSDEKHVVVPEHEKEAFLGLPQRSEELTKYSKQRLFGIQRRLIFLMLGTIVACCSILAIALAANLEKHSEWVVNMFLPVIVD